VARPDALPVAAMPAQAAACSAAAIAQPPGLVEICWRGRPVQVEHQWLGDPAAGRPLIVFLHEGLGSLAMWRDFPQRLCTAAGCRGLVYSRPGYGRSSPRAADEAWGPDFLHRQALEVLPALLAALGVDATRDKPWLFGHSDGGSIALLYAAHRPTQLAGAVLLAPHIRVEDVSISSIQRARQAYLDTDLRARLARHHDDPDSAFWGWNNIWLHPEFRGWTLEAEIASISCPLLAMQGVDDEYGTLDQINGIARRVPGTELRAFAACGHSPHRDQADAVIRETTAFMQTRLTPLTGDSP